jgi:hypothetical protein
MDSSSSWIDVEEGSNILLGPASMCDGCPLPLLAPNLKGPESGVQVVEHNNGKAELHRVLQSIQCSYDFGVYFCESFRDPRRHYIDDYWTEVSQEAFGIEELHRAIGRVDNTPLSDPARARLHQFARLLDRLARRIDRVVLS